MRIISLTKIVSVCCFIVFLIIIYLCINWYDLERDNELDLTRVFDVTRKRFTHQLAECRQTNIKFCVIENLWHSESIDTPTTLTLTTHLSANRFDSLRSLLEAWRGPTSVSVLVGNTSLEMFLSRLVVSIHCDAAFERLLSIHVVVETISVDFSTDTPPHAKCSTNQRQWSVTTTLPKISENYENLVYPNNLLRNVAIRNAGSPYVLPIDVDIIPPSNAFSLLTSFLRRTSAEEKKVVYVLPAFEKRNGSPMPQNKDELILYMKMNNIRLFYEELCPNCQSQFRKDLWIDIKTNNNTLNKVHYHVQWTYSWEPFYIALRSTLPKFNEMFSQYGFNRISQACEMHLAGFDFVVLDNLFLVHDGYKTESSFHSSKEREQNANRKLYESFSAHLKSIYNTNRSCK